MASLLAWYWMSSDGATMCCGGGGDAVTSRLLLTHEALAQMSASADCELPRLLCWRWCWAAHLWLSLRLLCWWGSCQVRAAAAESHARLRL